MTDLPATVHIMEVGPRDGLQIESRVLSVEERLRLIEALARTGVPEIEVGSFVNPKAVPQMAATEAVVARLPPREGTSYRGLWLNLRGLERAAASGLALHGALTLTASETFIRRNTNRSIDDTLAQMPDWIAAYRRFGVAANRLDVMAAFGCNFEGYIPRERVIGLIARAEAIMADHGCRLDVLTLADTMGWANPRDMKRMIGMVRERWPGLVVRLHLHDTRGQAVANAVAAMELGVRIFDASVGGLGGCPFAGHTGAAGNICTEDFVFTCREMGIETGIDLDALVEAAHLAEDLVGHTLPGKVMRGGTLSRFKAGRTAAPA